MMKNTSIVLREQGDSVIIPQSGMELSEYIVGVTKLKAILQWQTAVDLDIHAFYRLKNNDGDGHVGFHSKGSKKKAPYINLNKDMGVGNAGGNNQEIISVGTLEHIDSILIATNIFRVFSFLAKDDNFGKYDGVVRLITSSSNEVEVPLTSTMHGRWCVIALIDNSDPFSPLVTNINKVTNEEPKIDDYLDTDIFSITYDD